MTDTPLNESEIIDACQSRLSRPSNTQRKSPKIKDVINLTLKDTKGLVITNKIKYENVNFNP